MQYCQPEHTISERAMSDQRTFAGLAWSAKKKVTRREKFLAEMDAVIPWSVKNCCMGFVLGTS